MAGVLKAKVNGSWLEIGQSGVTGPPGPPGPPGAGVGISVKDYGAVGDGVADDTAAITAAWAAALAADTPLHFPAGTWMYNGPGLDPGGIGLPFVISGVGRATEIKLGASSYLVDSTLPLPEFQLSDMTITGGLGGIRSTSTAVATNATLRTVERVFFHNYTKAAISHSSTDCPNWQIKGCTFWADPTSQTSMGVAMSGLTDTVSIVECEFRHDRVHVKLGDGGNNAHIERCGFIRYDTVRPGGSPVIDLWVVPDTDYVNSGEGLTVTNNKFGNENLVAGDYRVVFAAEGAGTNFGDRFPDLATNLTADNRPVVGHVYSNNLLVGASGVAPPFIYSTTDSLVGIHVGPLTIAGIPPAHLVGISHKPANVYRHRASINTIGPIQGNLADMALVKVCNYSGLFGVADNSNGLLATHAIEPVTGPGEATGHKTIVDALSSDLWGVTGTPSTDVLGRPTAYVANITSGFSGGATLAPPWVPGAPMWIEFDMRQGGGTPVTQVKWQIVLNPNIVVWQRILDVPTSWTHYRFPFTIDDAGAAGVSLWMPTATLSGSGTVEIGRVRIYQARESLNVDGHIVDLAHRGTRAGFYGAAPTAKPTGVAVTAAAIHAALVALGLIGA